MWLSVEGEYVDLSLVPEQYTGYTGEKAHRVWKAIYDENCFGVSEQSASPPSALFSSVGQDDVQCLEKRVYYKIISGTASTWPHFLSSQSLPGLHASISTHICHDDMNQQTGLRVSLAWLVVHLTNQYSSVSQPFMFCKSSCVTSGTTTVYLLQHDLTTQSCRPYWTIPISLWLLLNRNECWWCWDTGKFGKSD